MNRMNRNSRYSILALALGACYMTSVVIPTSTGIGENTAGSDASVGTDPETGKLVENTVVATIGETDPSTLQAPAIPPEASAATAEAGTQTVVTPVPPVAGAAPTAPVAETKAQEKARLKKEAADKKAADKKAADEAKAAAAATAAATPKAPVDEKNGVTRPASGKTKTVWDIADQMSQQLKAPVERKALTDVLIAEPHNLVVGTIHTQYGKWRKYHGLVVAKPAEAPAAPAVPTAPVAPTAPAA